MSPTTLKEEVEDRWIWTHDASNTYIVKSAYKAIWHMTDLGVEDRKLNLLIWKSEAPLKILALAWRIMLDRLPCFLIIFLCIES
ncbi:hypothetical protein Lal_00018990 [Lupinus albus]|nr:hypothetical protein Lal_00018990 [Lupinus albus]